MVLSRDFLEISIFICRSVYFKFLDFIIRVSWPNNTRLQQVTALLDPPMTKVTKAKEPVLAPVVVVQAQPVIEPVAPPVMAEPEVNTPAPVKLGTSIGGGPLLRTRATGAPRLSGVPEIGSLESTTPALTVSLYFSRTRPTSRLTFASEVVAIALVSPTMVSASPTFSPTTRLTPSRVPSTTSRC